MSEMGQTRSFADVRAMSALPPEGVVERTSMDGRFVPIGDIRAEWAKASWTGHVTLD
jgi:hypothetical protein